MGLHDKIGLSFMVVEHTKFSPDGYFDLIKYRNRRSRVYTYEQLADLIERLTENGHNTCQRSSNAQDEPLIMYCDWSNWLLKYFRELPNLTNYHHFSMSRTKPGVVTVKERIDTPEEEYVLLRWYFPYEPNKFPRLLKELNSTVLSLERD